MSQPTSVVHSPAFKFAQGFVSKQDLKDAEKFEKQGNFKEAARWYKHAADSGNTQGVREFIRLCKEGHAGGETAEAREKTIQLYKAKLPNNEKKD